MYNIFFQKNKNNAALPHTQTQAALDNRWRAGELKQYNHQKEWKEGGKG